MTGFLQHPPVRDNMPVNRLPGSEPTSRLSPEQRDQWTAMVNLSQHPMMVFDDQFRPIVVNDVLRLQLSDPSIAEGTDQPTAFLWQRVCEAVSRIASEAATSGKSSFGEVLPINQRAFAVVGSVLRKDNRIVGAILNISDIAFPAATSSSESADAEDQQSFDDWSEKREKARQKMARLSRRESQVVSLVSDGLPNKSIARELDISVKTIEKHRANATRKLGVGSTAEMVRIAVVADAKGPDVEPRAPEPMAPPFFPQVN